MHGGRNGNALMDDVWVLDPHQSPAWAKLATKGPKPSHRAFHTLTAVGDKARHAVLLGGLVMAENGDLVHAEDDWVLDCSAAFFTRPSLGPGARARPGALGLCGAGACRASCMLLSATSKEIRIPWWRAARRSTRRR